ncbi:two-component system, OmpR family, phosphate regulon sensor histidine kinase PhoR [Spirosomataceae bacterium TFI 002]|nr:two-component system, OmpR family, phosphate regulon sensor histidine kinase PhoR [Spirosomataceae bacterium TFI 002]
MKNFRNIIIFMLIAFVALIAFQWYWIENAIAVKKEQFDRNVVEAMNATVAKIDKQEVIFLAKKKIREQERKSLEALAQPRKNPFPKRTKSQEPKPDLVKNQTIKKGDIAKSPNGRKKDSIPEGRLPSYEVVFNQPSDAFTGINRGVTNNELTFFKQMFEDQNRFWQNFNAGSQFFIGHDNGIEDIIATLDAEMNNMEFGTESYYIQQIDPLTGAIYLQSTTNVQQRPKHLPRNKTKKDTIRVDTQAKKPVKLVKSKPKEEVKTEQLRQENFEKTRNKAAIVKDVFTDFLQGNRTIFERLNQQMLDTLLKEELSNRGIAIKYEYGVKNIDKMIFTSYAENYDPKSSEKSYNVRLFPNDAMQQDQFLYVYFPERDQLIMGNMNTVFGSSIALLFLIGGIFYASINTMLQQKKLSTIKNDFINNMTHEFKTPISTISLAVEVMKDASVIKDKQKTDRYLGIIKDENNRLSLQVEKVLQMALLEKGEVKLNKQEIDIHEVIEQVYQNLGVQIEQKNGQVFLELEANNPIIEGDEVHLTNIVYNLMDNANKYSKESPQITIASENVNGSLKLTIRDEGIGMSKDQISRIFDRFYRVSTGNVHDVKGFGLGLSYVKKMLDLHNANIEVDSKINEGTTFTLYFHTQNV